MAVALSLGLACALRVSAADFTLTPAELQRIAARQIVIRANVDSGQRRGTVRAAVRIEAAPAIVFKMMTTCADALQYVPHLKVCRVRDRALDNSWLLVEHEIDFGWYAPRVKFAYHADLVADRSIAFHQVTGDFKAYEGVWDLEPADNGAHTLLLYRAYIDPPGYVPSWLARSTFKRELPQMLTELRRRCEAKQSASTGASVSPH
jgi:ribosome-associated toxin RatA of RatAB toxin-antitoxin module